MAKPHKRLGIRNGLDLGPDTRLATVRRLVGIGEWSVSISPLVGEIPDIGSQCLGSFPLRLAPVGAVTVEARFLAMQEMLDLLVSCTLAAVTVARWINPLLLSAPICIFRPNATGGPS